MSRNTDYFIEGCLDREYTKKNPDKWTNSRRHQSLEKHKKYLTIITLRQFAELFGVKREVIGELCVSEWHDKIGDAKRYKVFCFFLHSLSLSLSLFLCIYYKSFSLILSLFLAHTHTRTHIHTVTHFR